MLRVVGALFLAVLGAQLLVHFNAQAAGASWSSHSPELVAGLGTTAFLLLALLGALVVADYRHRLARHLSWIAHLLQMLWSIQEDDHRDALKGWTAERGVRFQLVSLGRFVLAPMFFALAAVLLVGAALVVLHRFAFF